MQIRHRNHGEGKTRERGIGETTVQRGGPALVALLVNPPAASMALPAVAIAMRVTTFAADSDQVRALPGMPHQRGAQAGDVRRAASVTRVLEAAQGQA
jgi:hypothetical protein